MEETVTINKKALIDLLKLKGEFDMIVESLELIQDAEFMDSYRKSKDQVKKRQFSNWDEL